MDADVVVVGAGLAGLRCAATLTGAGRHVIVVDRAPEVGGRVATEQVDGFLVDRGFQVLNPAYPAIRRWVDVDALGMQGFGAGVLVRTDAGLRTLADPRREPRRIPAALTSGLLSPRDLAGLGAWIAPVLAAPQRTLDADDVSLREAFDRAHVTGSLRRVVDRFLAGVVVDSHQTTSAAFVRLLLRSFALGRPGLPRDGMAALPRQVAAPLGDVRLSHDVEAVTPTSVRTSHGTLTADRVVVATDAATAERLTGLPTRETKGLVTWWWSAPDRPHGSTMLAVDARGSDAPPGPVWNTCVVSNAAPSYAPAGRHLVQATTLLDRPDGDAPEGDVRRHVGEILGCPTDGWSVLARHHLPDALPAVPPPLQHRLPLESPAGVLVCGDHRDTSSIQGALVSGERAARQVLAAR